MRKIKILFVCHGNICRSPMAEFIFRHLAEKRGVPHLFEVSSSATSTEEIIRGVGNPMYPPARAELKKRGIPFFERRAKQINREEYEYYDLILCMDESNVTNAKKLLLGDAQNKIERLMNRTLRPRDVADPWYSGRFDIAFTDIYEGCECLIEELLASE